MVLLRGSREFDGLDAYRRFVGEMVGRQNANDRKRIELERVSLLPYPSGGLPSMRRRSSR